MKKNPLHSDLLLLYNNHFNTLLQKSEILTKKEYHTFIKNFYDNLNIARIKPNEDNYIKLKNINNEFSKQIIIDACTFINEKIKNRKTKGQLFQDDLKNLQDIHNNIITSNSDIESNWTIIADTEQINKCVEEKISIEKYNKSKDDLSLIITILIAIFSFLLGIYWKDIVNFLFNIRF